MKKNCPHCGSVNEDVQFCVNCGADIAFQFVKQEKASDNTSASDGDANTYCMQCGAELKAGARFCTKCGHNCRQNKLKCPKCNSELPKNAGFCAYCGFSLKGEQRTPYKQTLDPMQPGYQTPSCPPQPSYTPRNHQEEDFYSTPAYRNTRGRFRAESSTITTLKRFLFSPVFLIGVIATTLSTLFSIAELFGSNSSMWIISNYLELFGFDSSIMETTAILMMLPSVLIVIGLWITVAQGAVREENMSTTGLAIIKVIVCIQLGIVCFISGAVVFWALVQATTGSSEETTLTNEVSIFSVPPALGMILVMIGIIALVILYYAKVIQSINTVTYTMSTSCPSSAVSIYVGVVLIIMGAGAALSMLQLLYVGMIDSALSALCLACSQLCFGITLFMYRSSMVWRELEYHSS